MTDTVPQRDPATSVIHLLRRASQHVTACWNASTVTDMTTPQYAILEVLFHSPEPIDQVTIGVRLGLDSSTTSYLIKRLQTDGNVEATVDPVNRRRHLISLTPEGRDAIVQAAPGAIAAEAAVLARLDPAEREQLTHLLQRLVGL